MHEHVRETQFEYVLDRGRAVLLTRLEGLKATATRKEDSPHHVVDRALENVALIIGLSRLPEVHEGLTFLAKRKVRITDFGASFSPVRRVIASTLRGKPAGLVQLRTFAPIVPDDPITLQYYDYTRNSPVIADVTRGFLSRLWDMDIDREQVRYLANLTGEKIIRKLLGMLRN